jgi:predicted GNAT family acetyltransferase
MDPFGILDLLGLPGSFALGATEEKDGFDEPAGLVVVSSSEEQLVIEWMFTVPEFRGRGIASELMMLVFEEAKARELPEVMARISEEYFWDIDYWDPESFFVNDVFKKEESALSEWDTSILRLSRVLMRDAKENEKAASDPQLVSLKELSKKERGEAAAALRKTYRTWIPKNFEDYLACADEELSLFLGRGEKCRAVLLTGKGGETRYPFFLASKEEEDTEKLARAALYMAEEVVPTHEKIRIRCERRATELLLRKFGLEADIYDIVTVTAETKVYDKMLARIDLEV